MSSISPISAHEGNLLWHLLRSIVIASAKHHARLVDGLTFAGREPDRFDHDELPARPALTEPSHASAVFVASPFEEDAERWDGLS